MQEPKNQQLWLKMRSDIYIRDKGICWVCNTFVDLDQYDLGHLVDRCNDGTDTYDNLTVMHKLCNLSKPRHNTLEEAMKWRMTATIGSIRPTITNPKAIIPHPRRYPRSNERVYKKSIVWHSWDTMGKNAPDKEDIEKAQRKYQEAVLKIKPATLCWVQGKPQYIGNTKECMWRLLAPPYTKADAFTMRKTPPGVSFNGDISLQSTLQTLNGVLTQSVTFSVGFMTYHLEPNGTSKPTITTLRNTESNNLVGMGRHQIPIEVWLKAKQRGISWKEFTESHRVATTGIGDGV